MSGIGGITESDVILAHASGAAVIGFNVRANNQARNAPSAMAFISLLQHHLQCRGRLKAALSGLLTPETREKFLGNAEILEVFTTARSARSRAAASPKAWSAAAPRSG